MVLQLTVLQEASHPRGGSQLVEQDVGVAAAHLAGGHWRNSGEEEREGQGSERRPRDESSAPVSCWRENNGNSASPVKRVSDGMAEGSRVFLCGIFSVIENEQEMKLLV